MKTRKNIKSIAKVCLSLLLVFALAIPTVKIMGNTTSGATSYSEGFENGLPSWASGAAAVNKVAHTGSYSMGLASDTSGIFNDLFAQAVNKVVTVWFYDSANYTFNRNLGGVNLTTDRLHHLSIGVTAGETDPNGVAINGAHYTLYHDGKYGNSRYDTGITRTTGWHQFVFDATSGTQIDAYLDGVKVGSIDDYTSIVGIKVGWHRANTGNSATAFDDITVTDSIPAFYEEGFENGLANWPATNASIVTNIAHSGTSSLGIASDSLTATPNKMFDSAVNMVLTIWFYDDASVSDIRRTFGGANIGGTGGYHHHLSLGVSSGDGVAGNHYALWNAGAAGHVFKDTGIVRTTGWHQFVFDATSGTHIDAYLDGVKVGSITEYTAIRGIKVGWHYSSSGMSKTAFDDITLTSSIPEYVKPPYYEQGFENGLVNWPSTNASIINTLSHSGSSSLSISEGKTATPNQMFAAPVNKVLTIWFYDDTTYDYARVFGGANLGGTGGYYHHLSIGVSAGEKDVNGTTINSKNYTLWNENSTSKRYDTGIARTTGWHQFVFDATSGTHIDAYIDGVKVGSITEYTAIRGIKVGWHRVDVGISRTAFDDITVADSMLETYNLAETGYVVKGATTDVIKINQLGATAGTELKNAGDYIIFNSNALYLKQVVLFRAGDAHPDDKVDVCDVIAAKKLLANTALDTKAGTLGADVDASGTVDNADYSAICNHIMGSSTIPGYEQ